MRALVAPDGRQTMGAAAPGRALLEVADLEVTFLTAHGERAAAVRGVSFRLERGEVLGLVGESGSGKSVTCLAILRLLAPNARVAGRVVYADRDVLTMSAEELRSFRATTARIVFQDPGTSLNPIRKVGWQLVESIQAARRTDRASAERRALELLDMVRISDGRRRLDAYPHELSGGMLQRIMIAMALAADPRFLICDEVTSALDVTTEAQIIELLRDLNRELGTAIIFTTHDLSLVSDLCGRVLTMYAGRVVEAGPSDLFLRDPVHPYSRLLRDAAPEAAPGESRLKVIAGAPPRATDAIAGCAFYPRCPLRIARCKTEVPPLLPAREGGAHTAACWVTAGD